MIWIDCGSQIIKIVKKKIINNQLKTLQYYVNLKNSKSLFSKLHHFYSRFGTSRYTGAVHLCTTSRAGGVFSKYLRLRYNRHDWVQWAIALGRNGPWHWPITGQAGHKPCSLGREKLMPFSSACQLRREIDWYFDVQLFLVILDFEIFDIGR